MESPAAPTFRPLGASLGHDLGFNLGVVFRHYVNASHDVVTQIPGAGRGYQVLAAAVHGEAGNQTALATRLGVDRTVMTYLVDDLENAGLVNRQQDPLDRRNRQLIATDRGHEVWAATESALKHVDEQVLDALGDDEREAFRGLLEQLAARAQALHPVASPCDVAIDLEAETLRTDAARRSAATRT